MIPFLQGRCLMFKKVCQASEQVAAGVSRRRFLGRLGAGAAALAASLGGLMAQRAIASGGPKRVCDNFYSDVCRGAAVGTSCGSKGAKCRATRDLGGGLYECHCLGAG